MTLRRRAVLARLGLVLAVGASASCAASGSAESDQDGAGEVSSPTVATQEPAAVPGSVPPVTTTPTVAPKNGAPRPAVTTPRRATSTTTTPPRTTRQPAVTTPRRTTTTTTAPLTTTTSLVERADWAVFNGVLRDTLIGGGDQAASVAVAIDGKIVHRAAFGKRVPGEDTEPSDRFRIASISKPIAAAAILQLVEARRLELDQAVLPLVARLLNVPIADPRATTITVRQLLGHASGVGNFEFELFYGGSGSCRQAAGIALSKSLAGEPGKSYRYSNMNYCLIGLVLEAVTGRPFASVIRNQVLEPVGAARMRVAGTGDLSKRDVLHVTSPGRNYMDTLGASGSWISSASDVVRFADSLDTSKRGWHPVSNESLALMKTPARRKDRDRDKYKDERKERDKNEDRDRELGAPWYGLGLMVYPDGSFGHTGTLENTHAMTMVRPDGVTWAVLVSGENPWQSSDLRAIVDGAMFTALARP